MQVPSDALHNARLTVVENVEGFDVAVPGDIPDSYKNGVNDLFGILGIGQDIEVDVV